MNEQGVRGAKLRHALTRQRKVPALVQERGLNPSDVEQRKRDVQWLNSVGFPRVAFGLALFLVVLILTAIIGPR